MGSRAPSERIRLQLPRGSSRWASSSAVTCAVTLGITALPHTLSAGGLAHLRKEFTDLAGGVRKRRPVVCSPA